MNTLTKHEFTMNVKKKKIFLQTVKKFDVMDYVDIFLIRLLHFFSLSLSLLLIII